MSLRSEGGATRAGEDRSVLLVTNFPTHYRAPLFEELARRADYQFAFFSQGTESFWQKHLGVTAARVDSEVLVGPTICCGIRLNFPLARKLFTAHYDAVVKCTNGRFELPTTWAVSRLRGKPFILWTGLWEHPSTAFHRITKPLMRRIYCEAGAIVVYGTHVSRYLVSEGVPREKIFVAENAIDNERFTRPARQEVVRDLRQQYLGQNHDSAVLAVSRLVPQKGLDVLIEAIARIPSSRRPALAIVGTGPEGDGLLAMAEAAGVRLVLLGGLPHADMVEVYEAADIYAMPSVSTPEVKETWGLGCNEAMCRSLPVVATTAVGAVAGGLVQDGKTGLVVQERDAQSLADSLDRLILNRDLRRRLGLAARERVEATSIPRMADAFEAAVEYAIGGRR